MNFLNDPISLFTTRKKRSFGKFNGFITPSESSVDKLTITKQPVQQGAMINDHAYKEPTELTMTIQFSRFSKPLEETYKELLELQSSREPFVVYTGKRVYNNMLIASLSNTTDKNTENVLAITLTLIEVLIVEVTPTSVPARSKQANSGKTGATEKSGKKSALVSIKEGIGNLLGGG